MTGPDPLLGFTESETEYGPALHFPPLDEETLGDVQDDMLALAAELAESTGCPVDVFVAHVGVVVHATGEPRPSVVLRIDHEATP